MKTQEHHLSRRQVLSISALGCTVGLPGCATKANEPAASPPTPEKGEPKPMTTTIPALSGTHQMTPLPFSPSSLNGLSERLIRSHHENNYGGAVKNLNRVELELRQTNAETPAFVVAALRDRELTFRNSKSLHEAYFGNLGADGKCSGAVEKALAGAYGSLGRFEEHFRATGAGLGGWSGWVVLALELDTGALRTIGAGHHTQALAAGVPLLVMDMYEHSYQMDFGAAVPRYIDAFFNNVNWDKVNERMSRAERAVLALQG